MKPLTVAEKTDYRETSRHADVLLTIEELKEFRPVFRVESMGKSARGQEMPVLVFGERPGTPVVLVIANIHAGEVEGKEALLWLLRSIAKGERAAWFKDVVLLITPIYNADGNERVTVANRGAQHGPLGGMGTRPNAQGLNLNRDAMKLETPEGRSLARLLTDYDPHVNVDLHTTNGSDHGYYLTYDPGFASLILWRFD